MEEWRGIYSSLGGVGIGSFMNICRSFDWIMWEG
jgi:hypothetical protein